MQCASNRYETVQIRTKLNRAVVMPKGQSDSHRAKSQRVLLVDDHPMIRERLAEVIQREPDLAVCGEAEDRDHALQAVEKTRPDLVIVDPTLKHSHGLDLIKDL